VSPSRDVTLLAHPAVPDAALAEYIAVGLPHDDSNPYRT